MYIPGDRFSAPHTQDSMNIFNITDIGFTGTVQGPMRENRYFTFFQVTEILPSQEP